MGSSHKSFKPGKKSTNGNSLRQTGPGKPGKGGGAGIMSPPAVRSRQKGISGSNSRGQAHGHVNKKRKALVMSNTRQYDFLDGDDDFM